MQYGLQGESLAFRRLEGGDGGRLEASEGAGTLTGVIGGSEASDKGDSTAFASAFSDKEMGNGVRE